MSPKYLLSYDYFGWYSAKCVNVFLWLGTNRGKRFKLFVGSGCLINRTRMCFQKNTFPVHFSSLMVFAVKIFLEGQVSSWSGFFIHQQESCKLDTLVLIVISLKSRLKNFKNDT